MLRRFFPVTMACLALSLAGCSRFVPVEGVVLMEGKPVEGASVMFMPQTPGCRPAGGWTDNQGRFRLKTDKTEGCMPGNYKVLVTKTSIKVEEVEKIAAKIPKSLTDPKQRQMAIQHQLDMKRASVTKYVVNDVFSKVDTTPLKIEVPTKGISDLELKVYE